MPSSNALAQRIVTAVALVAVLLPAFVLLPKTFGMALITLFVLGAAWEWSAFLAAPRATLRLVYVTAIAIAAATASLAVPDLVPVAYIAAGSMLWWVVA